MPSDGILGGITESVTIGLQIRLIFVFLLKLGKHWVSRVARTSWNCDHCKFLVV